MYQVRALKTFQSRYGFIRGGQIFTAEPKYAEELQRMHLVEVVQAGPRPDRIQAFRAAPRVLDAQGKEATTDLPPLSSDPVLAAPPENGTERPSSASRQVRARRRRTPVGAEENAK